MATRWLSVAMTQSEPFDGGVDASGWSLEIFNCIVTKRPSSTLIEEAIAVLVAAGVGTYAGANRTIFGTTAASVPPFAPGKGPYTTVIATGGVFGLDTQQSTNGPAYPRPGLQVAVRGENHVVARAKAWQALRALGAVRNANVTPVTP